MGKANFRSAAGPVVQTYKLSLDPGGGVVE